MQDPNTDNLIDELAYVVSALNGAMLRGASSSSILQAATSLMLVRRLDLILSIADAEKLSRPPAA